METINGIVFNLQVALTGVAAISVDKFGRKPLILLSGLGTCISIVALGIYFYLDENKNCVSNTEIQPPLIFNQSKIFDKLAMEFFPKFQFLILCRQLRFLQTRLKISFLLQSLWHSIQPFFQVSTKPKSMKCAFQVQTLIHKSLRASVGYPQ